MDERKIRSEYKKIFDEIHAGEDLRLRILEQKPQKRSIRPIINIAGSVAAAVMIFTAVGDYSFNTDKSGIISESVVMQTEKPSSGSGMSAASKAAPSETESAQIPKDANAGSAAETPTAAPSVKATAKPSVKATAKPATDNGKRGSTSGTETNRASSSSGARGDSTAASPAPVYNEPVNESKTFEIDVEDKNNSGSSQTYEQESGTNNTTSDPGTKEKGENTTADIAVPRVSRGYSGALLKMNSSSVLSMIPQGASAMSTAEYADDGIYHQEEWDNNRYFNYIGSDILGKIILPANISYTGDETAYFMVDQDGIPQNDTRIFAFTGGESRVTILTSRDTSFAETYLSYPGLEISDISGNKAIIFEAENTYKCYMIYNSTSYIIDTVQLTEDELAQLLVSLVG